MTAAQVQEAFDAYWATTGPWPNNILGTAFKDLAFEAFCAGVATQVCKTCKGAKQILYLYARPPGPPGNQMGPCPTCTPRTP